MAAEQLLDGFDSLSELALNLRWSWSHCADALWRQLNPALWELTYNPWAVYRSPRQRGMWTMPQRRA